MADAEQVADDQTPQTEQAADDVQAMWDRLVTESEGGPDPDPEIITGQTSENANNSDESDGRAAEIAPPAEGSPKQAAPDFEHQFKSAQGRLKDANRKIAELQAALAAATPDNRRQDAAVSGATNEGDDPLEALTREYPELAAPLVDEIRQLRRTVTDLQGFRSDFAQREVAAQATQQASLLAERFPDLAQLDPDRNGILLPAVQAEFVAWLDTQPRYVKDVVGRNAERIESVEDVSDILERFQSSRAGQTAAPKQALTERAQSVASRRERQLGDAAAPIGRPAAGRQQAGPPDDPAAAWAYFAKLEQERGRA